MAAWAGAACLLYSRRGLWVELVVPEVAAGAALGGSLLAGYLVEGRSARRLRRGFARFLSPEVLAEVAGDLDNLRPGIGRRREITVMFCDARGFTPLAEKLAPEAAVELLDLYLGAMSDCILAHGGTLSKYIGDGIMAFWGAPAARPDHAERAARAALDMVRAQEALKRRLAAAGKPAFDIGIGLHAGEAVVGTVGSEQRLDYTAIGDTVNLASRVEGLTKDFQVRICVTADLAGRAGKNFEFRELGRVQVKGRSVGVEVLELVGTRGETKPEGGT
jgi:adenylate cyclase